MTAKQAAKRCRQLRALFDSWLKTQQLNRRWLSDEMQDALVLGLKLSPNGELGAEYAGFLEPQYQERGSKALCAARETWGHFLAATRADRSPGSKQLPLF